MACAPQRAAALGGALLTPPRARPADAGEHSLALAVHSGARGALAQLVETHQNALFGYALRLLQDEGDAEDVTQEAFLRANHALTSVYDEARCRDLRLRPWLLRIVRNLAYNQLRSRRAAREEPLPAGEAWHGPELRIAPAAEEDVAARERTEELRRALARLDAAGREALQLRFVEGQSYAEIAAVTGGSAAAARGKVFRALARLRARPFLEEARHAL